MTQPFDCDLLVVGLGPVGDAMAGLAALGGLRVIAIDREAAPFPLPRAAVFDHEIMRIFQMLGVAERIAPLCRVPDHYRFVTARGETLLDFELGAAQTVSGWHETYALHQPAVEAVLRARLTELGVDVRLGLNLVGLSQNADGVSATLRNGDTLHARYLVGCDGASSRVREAIGATMFDYDFDEPWLVIDTLVDDPGDLPITCLQICDPARPVTYIAMSAPRHRWEFMLKPGETAEQLTGDDSLRALLAPWNCFERLTIERKAVYRFHGLVTEQWRHGRVLLAGDAAHQMPPFAGQGMCSGIRDAGNLAWKLCAVIQGRASEALLDTYQHEREPHVRAIIETAIAMGRIVCLQDEAAAAARDRDMLARKAGGAQDVSMAYPDLAGGCLMDTSGSGALFVQPVLAGVRLDDVLGSGTWLIGHDLPKAGPDESPASLLRVDVQDLSPAFAAAIDAWLTQHAAAAVLVRPDRHVFGTGEPGFLADRWFEALQRQDMILANGPREHIHRAGAP